MVIDEYYFSKIMVNGVFQRVYWHGDIYSKDENKTYSFNVEGDTKELAIDRLVEMYGKNQLNYFKDKWVIKSIERVK
jgi:hypothetical protein